MKPFVLFLLTVGVIVNFSAEAKPRYQPAIVGVRVINLPAHHDMIRFGRKSYYISAGVYYQKRGKDYVVVRAPAGYRISKLPAGYVTVRVGSKRYFHFAGTYYIKRGDQYEVVVIS